MLQLLRDESEIADERPKFGNRGPYVTVYYNGFGFDVDLSLSNFKGVHRVEGSIVENNASGSNAFLTVGIYPYQENHKENIALPS